MTHALIELGQAQQAYDGEAEIGDRCVVKLFEDRALVAVIDGLGHGREAAEAAAAAAAVLDEFVDEPLDALMQRCHERLVATRGAAITVVLFDARDRLLKWVGAGNVAAVLNHAERVGNSERHELLVRSGVAGAFLPSIEVSAMALVEGDIVVLATDGLRPSFGEGISRFESPQRLAERLLAEYHTARDDALVVVAKLRRELA